MFDVMNGNGKGHEPKDRLTSLVLSNRAKEEPTGLLCFIRSPFFSDVIRSVAE